MIVRDEEQQLRACLEPVARLFDEIVVVDTGSHDRTRELASELGARVADFAWCDDFSAARNASLDLATGDYIFWLDADDRVDEMNQRRLRDLLDGLNGDGLAYVMNCVSPAEGDPDSGLVLSHCRLFPRWPEIRWSRRVHEQVLPSVEHAGCPVMFSQVELLHLGYCDPALLRRKLNRDLRLLRLEHAVAPEDPVTLFNLGATQLRVGANDEALKYFITSLQHVQGRCDWQRRLYALTSTALRRLGRTHDALAIMNEGLRLFPNDPELLTDRADTLAKLGDLAGAEQTLLRLLRAPSDQYLVASQKSLLERREPRRLLGLVYCEQGRHQEAEQVLQDLLWEVPHYAHGWVSLGYVYLVQRRFAAIQHVNERLAQCPQGAVFVLVLQAETLIASGDLAAARPLLDAAISQAPQMIWPRLVLADWLDKSGADLEQRRQAQRDILRLDPGNLSARANLALLDQLAACETAASPFNWQVTV